MIRRLYIHNFKSFINFEIRFDNFQLLTGANGVGKSAMFDVLGRLKAFVCNSERIQSVFPSENTSKGISGNDGLMRIELDMQNSADALYCYTLVMEYDDINHQQHIAEERLTYNQSPLFESIKGAAQLYRDNGSAGPNFPMDWTQSGVGFVMAGKDTTKMTWFKERLSRVWILRIAPDMIKDESRREAISPQSNLNDFADWYRYLAQTQPDVIQKLTNDLRFRLPGFHTLRLKDAGEGKILYASFESEVGKKSIDIPFGQISEGQKALIGLYAALYGLFSDNDATLCVDEPENFLALPEVQPWLDRLYEMCQEETRQGLIISHHPRVLNFLAADTGIWFERSNGTGPTRNWAISLNADSLISVDQLIERGWIDGVSK